MKMEYCLERPQKMINHMKWHANISAKPYDSIVTIQIARDLFESKKTCYVLLHTGIFDVKTGQVMR